PAVDERLLAPQCGRFSQSRLGTRHPGEPLAPPGSGLLGNGRFLCARGSAQRKPFPASRIQRRNVHDVWQDLSLPERHARETRRPGIFSRYRTGGHQDEMGPRPIEISPATARIVAGKDAEEGGRNLAHMSVIEKFRTMEYGPAPEDPKESLLW